MLGPCHRVFQAVEGVEEREEEQANLDAAVDKRATTAEKFETRGSGDALPLAHSMRVWGMARVCSVICLD